MSYQLNTPYPSRQVHCYSQAGLGLTSSSGSELFFHFNEMLADVPDTVDILLSVVSATVPYSWPNVATAQMNNSFVYVVAESPLVPRLITVPDGYYNVLELIDYLNKSPQFLADNLTATYARPTGLVTIARSATASAVVFGLAVGATLPWIPLSSCSLAAVLGFNLSYFSAASMAYTLFTGGGIATTWYGSTPVSLLHTQSVWIESDFLTDSFDSRSGGRTPVLARVPVTGIPGTYIQWQNITGQRVRVHQKQIGSQVLLRLTDDNQNLLDFRNRPWCVTLQVDFVHQLEHPDTERDALGGLSVFANNCRLG